MTTADRVPTTHIGSLPRPDALRSRLAERSTGEGVDDPTVRELADSATEQAVRKQAEIGLDIANNGEQSRTGFHLHVTNRLSGFGEPAPAPFWADVEAFPGFAEAAFAYPETDPATGAPLRPAVTGPIEYVGEAYARAELRTFRSAVETVDHGFEDLFMTSPSPGIVATSLPNAYYDSHEAYLTALSDALATEYALVTDADVLLQIDAPDLLHTHHRSFPGGKPDALRADRPYQEVIAPQVDAINAALPDVPRDRIRVHTCWGNYDGPHHLDIPLEDAIPALLDLEVGGLAVELSGPRHAHEYRVFDGIDWPEEMTLLPGVVDVKTNAIDHPETVADRIERVAGAIDDPRRLVAVPDCGFGTLAWSAAAEGIAWGKLTSLVEGARIASDRLF